jgi:hypothetical protein
MKLRVRAPRVAKDSVLDAAIMGMRMGPCAECLDRCRPTSVKELFKVI